MPLVEIFAPVMLRTLVFALRAASNLEITTREQRALLIFSACSNPYGNPFLKNKTENILKRGFNLERTHPRRPKGSQSGQEKRRDESFQVRAKEPLGTDSHRTISKNASRCRLLIGHKKYSVFILCLIGEQFLLSSFREFLYDGYLDHGLSGSCTKEMKAVRKLSVWYKTPIWFQNIVCRKTKGAFPKIQAWACFAMWRYC